MKGNVLKIILLVVMILLIVLVNVQLYILSSRILPVGVQWPEETPRAYTNASGDSSASHGVSGRSGLPLEQQLGSRIKIDDFLAPDLWGGTKNESEKESYIKISSRDGHAETSRKFDGFLHLQAYFFLDITAENLGDFEWITLYLMEDLSYSNYFECNLLPFLLKNADASGDKNHVIINKRDFTIGSGNPKWDSVSTVKIAFQTAGAATTSITVGEISTYGAYPLCSLWFDDGWQSTYTQAFPAMKKRGFKGTLALVSSYVNCPAFCNETQLKTMYDYGWDFTNHTHNHANLVELPPDKAQQEIAACLQYLAAHGYTRGADHFVPPYCATNARVDALISKFAATSRPKWSAYNYLPIVNPYNLGFREVTAQTTPDMVEEWITEAIQNDLWLVLMFHSIESRADATTKYDIADFERILDFLHEKRADIKTVTLTEALGAELIRPASIQENLSKKEWTLVWEDNFEAGALDETSWNVVSAAPFKNKELQTYRPDRVSVQEGCLQISSSQEDTAYVSGAVTTDNKRLFHYGKIEIKARLPSGQGIFPSFWMVPSSGALLPEIDIIEFLGHAPNKIWHVMHFPENDTKGTCYVEVETKDNLDQDFHVFSLEWSEQSVKWFIDGKETYAADNNIPSEKMYLYINTAIGGEWPGSPDDSTRFPQSMLVDSVKYYTRNVTL